MKKKSIWILPLVVVFAAGAFWTKGYYNDRYVVSDYYYTQIPEDEMNEDSWLLDSDGAKQVKGKEYELVAYNAQGEEREVYFTKTGSAEDYYAPGTYIQVSTSKTLVAGVAVVNEEDVPPAALEQIDTLGTRIR